MDTILYVGGFQLPDKNAAAFRVLSNAKAFRALGYRVVFVNALMSCDASGVKSTSYEGFETFEYQRESQLEYLTQCKRIVSFAKQVDAKHIVCYNHPAIALNKLRKYCKKNSIKCYADATEWYVPRGNLLFRLIKGFDTEMRMRYVQPKMDGVIAISEYLYQYYKDKVKTVKIPPLVDNKEFKWQVSREKAEGVTQFIYAGSPSAQKERLDLIVNAVEGVESSEPVVLDIVGITEEQYNRMYQTVYSGNRVRFHGRIPNARVIEMTSRAHWSIIIRDDNKVVKAGFPTKVVESISCATPVVVNRFSNIFDYLDEKNCCPLEENESLEIVLKRAIENKKTAESDLFDYHRFLGEFQTLLNG